VSDHIDTQSLPIIFSDLPSLSTALRGDETEGEPGKSWYDHAQRLTARAQCTRQMQADALGALASVLHEQPTEPVPSDGPPLLLAARAVGATMGVSIAPPARSEDLSRLKDPLEAIARASHLRLREVILTGKWWRRDGGPLLAYLGEERRPVALLPVSPTHYDLFDPSTQTRCRVHARLAASLAPVARLLYRPLPEAGRHASALLHFALRGHGRTLGSTVLMGVATTLLGMLLPQATALVIDYAIPDADRQAVLHIGACLALGAVGAALFQLVQGVSLLRLEHGAAATMQAAMWDWLLRLQPTFFRRHSVGDLASRVSAIHDMRLKLSGTTIRTLFAGVTACLNLGLMFYYSSSLALVACAATLVVVLVTLVAGLLTIRQVNQLKTITANVFGLLVQLLGGVAKLRVAGAEARAFAVWAQQYSQQQSLRQRVQRLADAAQVFNDIMPTVTYASLFWGAALALDVGPRMAAHGFSAGTFLAFYAAFGFFIGAATALSNVLIDTVDLAALWQRARPIIQAEPETNAY
jgi:ABC-type bacteriocin/lantibiotic exporter with double-glycine peptidase domain